MLSSQANPLARQLARSIPDAQPQSRCLRPATRPVARYSSEQPVAVSGRPRTLLQLLRLGLHRTVRVPVQFLQTRSGQLSLIRATRTLSMLERVSRTAPAIRRPALVSTSPPMAAVRGRSSLAAPQTRPPALRMLRRSRVQSPRDVRSVQSLSITLTLATPSF